MQTTTNNETMVVTTQEQQKMDFLKPDSMVTVRGQNGKYSRKLVYSPLNTVTHSQNRADLMRLTAILSGSDDELVQAFSDNIGATFELENVIFKPYESINDLTGELEYGVVSYLFGAGEEKPYVTSSKSVYITLKNYFAVFGIPNTPEYLGLTLTIVNKKGRDHDYKDVVVQ